MAGTASHAEVGDLYGTWSLTAADSGADAGFLEVTRGGLATYSTGEQGQFVLFHTRSDPRYPGAFFLEHQGVAVTAGRGAGWEYAWLEDNVKSSVAPYSTGTRLTVRRFCGQGPAVCQQKSSPEGSPLFVGTFHGIKTSNTVSEEKAEKDCLLLEGVDGANESCCLAAAAIESQQSDNYLASVTVQSSRWEAVQLISADWNSGGDAAAQQAWYQKLQQLKGARIAPLLDSYDLLCPGDGSGVDLSSLNQAVAIARRGVCPFSQKALVAQQAGAVALLVVNGNGTMLPELKLVGNNQAPSIPTWKMSKAVGEEIIDALKSGQGTLVSLGRSTDTTDTSSLKDLCCEAACRTRVASALGAGRPGVPDMPGVCALATCVAPQVSSAIVLPSASGSCSPCDSKMAATVQGLASCSLCGDGTRAAAGGASCEPCPAGKAGTGGKCLDCGPGLEPDDLRRHCAAPPPTPAPAPAPTCPPAPATGGTSNTNTNTNANTNSNTNTNANTNSGNTGIQYGTPSPGGVYANTDDGFPWVTLIVIVVAICLCGCFGVYAFRMLQHYSDNTPGGGPLAKVMGKLPGGLGSSKDDSDDEDEEEGKKKPQPKRKLSKNDDDDPPPKGDAPKGDAPKVKSDGPQPKKKVNKEDGAAASSAEGKGAKKGGAEAEDPWDGGGAASKKGAPKTFQMGGIRVNIS